MRDRLALVSVRRKPRRIDRVQNLALIVTVRPRDRVERRPWQPVNCSLPHVSPSVHISINEQKHNFTFEEFALGCFAGDCFLDDSRGLTNNVPFALWGSWPN